MNDAHSDEGYLQTLLETINGKLDSQQQELSALAAAVTGRHTPAVSKSESRAVRVLKAPFRFLKWFFKKLFINRFTRLVWHGLKSLRRSGFKQTAGKVGRKFRSGGNPPETQSRPELFAVDADIYLNRSFRDLQAIPCQTMDKPVRRLNLVTDSIEPSSLLGGVATALITATLFASRYGCPLRIITRNAPVNPRDYYEILRLNQLEAPPSVTFYSDYDRDKDGKKIFKLDVSSEDIFFATSWWSAEAIRKINLRKRFFYIVQEVETFFYPHGYMHYLCSQIMNADNIDFIINSHYLCDYFQVNHPNIAERGVYFEPAFSRAL
ncbi:MAG: hypothetical protein FWF49_00160 [Oscillospiraceae bacterium]|nr:hypothetical protein [Oscillospiraceae bacterium]